MDQHPQSALTLTPPSGDDSAPARTEEIQLPEQFLARYTLERELGRGACGVVVCATDKKLGRQVAIKFLYGSPDARMTNRFRLEARLLAQLSHPNVVTLYYHDAVGEHAYMVMELVQGGSLRGHLESAKGPLPVREAVMLAIKCLAGLEVVHHAGVIHRDLKPENVLMTPAGEPKIADLGMSLHQNTATRLTQTGGVVGTLRYMGPEQLQSLEVTARSDLHAMAAMLYELVTGAAPYRAPRLEELVQQIMHTPPPDAHGVRPEVPPRVAAAIQRAMSKDPAERPASAAELSAELTEALKPARGGPRPLPRPLPRTVPVASAPPAGSGQNPGAIAALAAALTLVLLATGVMVFRATPATDVVRIKEILPSPTPWSEPRALAVEAALNEVAKLQPARQQAWSELHQIKSFAPGARSRNRHPTRAIRTAVDQDHAALDVAAKALEALTAGREATPLEQVIESRLLAHRFMVEALQLRLAQYARLSGDGKEAAFENAARFVTDQDPFDGPAPGRLRAFCTAFPRGLTALATAGADGGQRVGQLVVDLAHVLHWLYSLNLAAQESAVATASFERLRTVLGAPGGPALEHARRAALAVVIWKRDTTSRKPVREKLNELLPDFVQLGEQVPASRAALTELAGRIRRELDSYDRKSPRPE